jgi:hypothetical protein
MGQVEYLHRAAFYVNLNHVGEQVGGESRLELEKLGEIDRAERRRQKFSS